MDKNRIKQSNIYGVNFMDLLAIAFIVLKLCNVIEWSWLLVIAPMWIQILSIIVTMVMTVISTKIKN